MRDIGESGALAEQQLIFERFARAVISRYRSEGSGLGLSIVQAIAGAHHGQVKLPSQLCHASIFFLILPLPGAGA